MKRRLLRHKFALGLVAALAFASCSQDEPAEQGTLLPDGMYPMTFTAMQVAPENTPQTRVSEGGGGTSSQWDGGEVIKVTVSGVGNTDCTLDESGNITAYDPQLYWQNTNDATVNAWYSNITGQSTVAENTVSLSDQSSGLAYVLKVEKPVPANYQAKNIALKFSHQLAKIRVKLEKGSYQGDLSNATVKVKGYTSCTVTNGDVSGGSEEGYITMHKNGEYYEANLVPGTLQASEAFDISAGDKTTKASLKGDVSLEKGKVHTITITVNAEGPEEITGGETIDKPGDYIMKDNIAKSVTLNGDNIKLTLEDVTFNGENAPIHITGGTPTIIIKGTNNSLITNGKPGIWVDGDNTNVEITGDGSSNSCIKIDSYAAAIGTTGGDNPKCGNITIKDVKIIANIKEAGAAAIGYGAAYGNGSNQKIGDITIINSEIEAHLSENEWFPYGAVVGGCGGGEGTYQIGDIRITTSDSGTTPKDYFNKCTCGDVWVGFPPSDYTPTVSPFKIYWNGVEQAGNITK